jgi:hypothetical protein
MLSFEKTTCLCDLRMTEKNTGRNIFASRKTIEGDDANF